MIYINRYDVVFKTTETVSDYEDKHQARADLTEYQISEPSNVARYSLSKTPTNDWEG
jgi:hypothetical protein